MDFQVYSKYYRFIHRNLQIDLTGGKIRRRREGREKKDPRSFLTKSHEHDEEVAPHDGDDKPGAHPEPDPLGEEEGRPQEPDKADEPEEEPGSQGPDGYHLYRNDGRHAS